MVQNQHVYIGKDVENGKDVDRNYSDITEEILTALRSGGMSIYDNITVSIQECGVIIDTTHSVEKCVNDRQRVRSVLQIDLATYDIKRRSGDLLPFAIGTAVSGATALGNNYFIEPADLHECQSEIQFPQPGNTEINYYCDGTVGKEKNRIFYFLFARGPNGDRIEAALEDASILGMCGER